MLVLRRAVALVAMAGLVAVAGCSSGKVKSGSGKDGGKPGSPGPGQVALEVTGPAEGATNVPVTAEIAVKVMNGKVDTVELGDGKGGKPAGEMRADGSSWVPGEPLGYGTEYTATVTATGEDGKKATKTTKFTTMARPGNRVASGLYLADGKTYGVAMPIVVEFPDGVADADKAVIEKRLFAKVDPPQPAVWHWDSNRQVEFRGKEYWKPGTKISMRSGFGGLPLANGKYGDVDRTASMTISDHATVFTADNASKKLTVTRDGQVVKEAPVSLGKPSTPSSYGHMVVMSKDEKTIFDSTADGCGKGCPEYYRTDIAFAERLTWGGEFIHAAPWSVDDQGKRNVSHGCVNMSTDNAKWVFDNILIGDPVIVLGTERKLVQGNGWTVWDISWDEAVKGSALPHPELSAPASPSPSPSQ